MGLIIETLNEHIVLGSECVQLKSSLHRILSSSAPCFISNTERGKLIIERYTCINSKELTYLVASGYTHVKVLKKLSIGILTIGNKLQEPGQPLKPEHSYDCNRIFLISLLKENGINCNTKDFGIINDE